MNYDSDGEYYEGYDGWRRDDEYGYGWKNNLKFGRSFGDDYNSDTYFIDSEGEEMNKLVEGYKKTRTRRIPLNSLFKPPLGKFENWKFLPSELKEMIADNLDFKTWLNLMICNENNRGNYKLPNFSLYVKRFSFYSDVIQTESKEMEHIRIRLLGRSRRMMVKIKECDGYCTLSWNLDNFNVGSVKISSCSYLKVAERIMKRLFDSSCTSFKMVVEKNKTDPSAQSVSKWPFFHTYLKKCLLIENDDRKLVDEQAIVDFIITKTANPFIKLPAMEGLLYFCSGRRIDFILKLPQLDAKQVVDSINKQLPEVLADREKSKHARRGMKYFYGRYSVTCIGENTIKMDG